jgi:N-acyl-D-aspartate/D-glutamate deacylase
MTAITLELEIGDVGEYQLTTAETKSSVDSARVWIRPGFIDGHHNYSGNQVNSLLPVWAVQ